MTNVLEDAKVYSQHSGKKNIDLDDVKLSVSMNTEQTFTSPPPREALLELARVKNAVQVILSSILSMVNNALFSLVSFRSRPTNWD